MKAEWGTVDGKVYGWTRCLPSQPGAAQAEARHLEPEGGSNCDGIDLVGLDEQSGSGSPGGSEVHSGEADEPAHQGALDDTGGW